MYVFQFVVSLFILGTLGLPVVVHAEPPTAGLVAYFPFEDSAEDASGNRNNGTEYGGASYVDGVVGRALKLQGVNSAGGTRTPEYVLVRNSPSLQFSNAVTFSYWVRINGDRAQTGANCSGAAVPGIRGTLLAKRGDRRGFFISESEISTSFGVDPYSGGRGFGVGSIPSAYGTFRHVVYAISGNEITVYVDGERRGSGNGNVSFSNANSENLYIGVQSNSPYACLNYWFPLDGAIDELRIYNRALSEDEAVALYTADTATVPNEPPIVSDITIGGEDAVAAATMIQEFQDAGKVTIDLLSTAADPDEDVLEVSDVEAIDPQVGTMDEIDERHIAYTPDPGYTGTFSFGFSVSDGRGHTTPAKVTITVPDADTDGDALPDVWELFGLPQEGNPGLWALVPGVATVGIKDLFLWIDHMIRPAKWEFDFPLPEATRHPEIALSPSREMIGSLSDLGPEQAVKDCLTSRNDDPDALVDPIPCLRDRDSYQPVAQESLVQSFARRGIYLHVSYGSTLHQVPYQQYLSYQQFLDGTPTFKADTTYRLRPFAGNLERVYRYALIVDGLENSQSKTSGQSSIPPFYQNQTILIERNPGGDGSDHAALGVLMHEFGHSLGLGHGGPVLETVFVNDGSVPQLLKSWCELNASGKSRSRCMLMLARQYGSNDDSDNPNPNYLDIQANEKNKPNYLSIMNYLYSSGLMLQRANGPVLEGFLDFSIFELPAIDEGFVDEGFNYFPAQQPAGRWQIPDAQLSDYKICVAQNTVGKEQKCVRSERAGWFHEHGFLDWNNNGVRDLSTYALDLNGLNMGERLEVLPSFNDWDNLIFGGWLIGVPEGSEFDASVGAVAIDIDADDSRADRRYFNYAYTLSPFDEGVFRVRTRPGQSASLGAYLRNAGLQADSYHIEITTDLPWVVDVAEDLSLASGNWVALPIRIDVPADAAEGAVAQVHVLVRSNGNPLLTETEDFYVEIDSSLPTDSDGDSLTDEQEIVLGLDPDDPDSDGDGLSDGVEILNPSAPEDRDGNGLVDAMEPDNVLPTDSDGDGVSDMLEVSLGLNPAVADSDGDGINDGLEVGRPGVDAQPIDFDGDGEIDALEAGDDAYSVAGDMDGDFDIDSDDLTVMRGYFGRTPTEEAVMFDINADGRIDVRDFRGLASMCSRPRCASQ